MNFTTPTTHTARKRHRCTWCGEWINPTEQYSRYRVYGDDEPGTVKMHPECLGAMHEAAHEEGGWIEFIPYDNDRPPSGKGGA